LLEILVRKRAGKGVWKQAKAAATAKIISKMLKKHPLIAAETAISGLARGVKVGVFQIKKKAFTNG
jgi:hypothetical protein